MTPSRNLRAHRQSGMSLIELMVAMTIGLMLVLMVTQYLIASRQSYQSSMANGDVQDARRFALNVVRQQLWLTGYSDSWEDFDVTFPAFDGESADVPSFEAAQLVASTGNDVWLRYRAPTLANQPITHCDGTVFTAADGDANGNGNGNAMAISQVYLNDRTLYCKIYFADGKPNAALPLLDDVDAVSFAFLDEDDTWKTDNVDWNSVRAVRLSVIVASNAPSGERFSQQFELNDETLDFDDGKARTLAEITTALRNLPEAAQ